MDVYMTIYRLFTNSKGFDDEMEIDIKGHYDKDDDSLEVLEVTDTFDKKPVKLTPEERRKVGTVEFPEWLEYKGLFDRTGKYTTFYWVENGATVVEVEEYYESNSSKIVRAQNIHAKGGNS